MSQIHKPVMLQEILDYIELMPSKNSLLDLTFGRGGHSFAINKKFDQLKMMVMDQDLEAIQWAHQKAPEGFNIYHQNFKDLKQNKFKILQENRLEEGIDIILLDLGVSSPQLDSPERGFSFYENGALDMRMDQSQNRSAKDIINSSDEKELIKLFQEYGEIRNPRKVVNSIIRTRKQQAFLTTQQLSKAITKVCPWRQRGRHPATTYFMALRLAVNQELEALEQGLPHILDMLSRGGRLFVLTFHSLEATIVKKFFKRCCLEKIGNLVCKKVIKPSREEILSNPRSRSAQLRIFERA